MKFKNIFSILGIVSLVFNTSCSSTSEDNNILKKSTENKSSAFEESNSSLSKTKESKSIFDLSKKMKIKLTPFVPKFEGVQDSDIKLLKNRLNNAITKVGYGGEGSNPRFIVGPSVNILTQDITSTAPTKYAFTYEINFMVVDIVSETVFNSYKQEFKGVGDSQEKAFISGARNLDLNTQSFMDFLVESEKKIFSYFEDNCSTLLAEAESEAGMRNYDQAFAILNSVPKESKECFKTIQSKKTEFFQLSLNSSCSELLSKMRAELGKFNDPSAAGFNPEAMNYYSMIDSKADCYADAQKEYKAYITKLKPEARRDWEQKMKEYNHQIAMVKADKEFSREEAKQAHDFKVRMAELEARKEIEGNKKLLAKYKYDDSPWLIRLFASGSKLIKGEMGTN